MEGEDHYSAVPLTFKRGLLALYGKASIAAELAATLSGEGVEAAVARYHAVGAADPGGYRLGEGELNGLGYGLLREGRMAEALAMLELNAEAFLESANVFDSLGEAYAAAGDPERAVSNYRRSLALDPANDRARHALRERAAAE